MPVRLASRRRRSGSRPIPGSRQVDERRAAAATEVAQLVGDRVLVGRELPVIPSVLDVPEVDAGVLVGKGEADALGWDRPTDGHDSRSHRGSPPMFGWASVSLGGAADAPMEWTGRSVPSLGAKRNPCRPSPPAGMLHAAPRCGDSGGLTALDDDHAGVNRGRLGRRTARAGPGRRAAAAGRGHASRPACAEAGAHRHLSRSAWTTAG